MTDSIDMLALLAQRSSLVEQIADGGASKRDLTITLPHSRSTITRALKDLIAANVLQKVDTNYELTLHGRVVYREFRRVIDRYNGLTAASPLLGHLPETTTLPGALFDDATIIQPTPPAPDTPQTQFACRIRQSDAVTGIAPVVRQRFIELFHNQFITHDLQLTLVLDEQVIEHLRHAHHTALSTALQTDHCTLLSLEQTPPFSLAIVDQTDLWFGVYNECGQLQGILRTESSAAVTWAKQYIQQYAEQATRVCEQEVIAEHSTERSSS